MKEREPDIPDWPGPFGPYGAAEAVSTTGAVAAPLLAGFAMTMAVVSVNLPDKLRWPATVSVLAVAASICLITTVQLTAWARQHYATPEDVRNWFEDSDTANRRPLLVAELEAEAILFHNYSRQAGLCYSFGVILLFSALGFLVAPAPVASDDVGRWIAAGLAWAAAAGELVWWLIGGRGRIRRTRKESR